MGKPTDEALNIFVGVVKPFPGDVGSKDDGRAGVKPPIRFCPEECPEDRRHIEHHVVPMIIRIRLPTRDEGNWSQAWVRHMSITDEALESSLCQTHAGPSHSPILNNIHLS